MNEKADLKPNAVVWTLVKEGYWPAVVLRVENEHCYVRLLGEHSMTNTEIHVTSSNLINYQLNLHYACVNDATKLKLLFIACNQAQSLGIPEQRELFQTQPFAKFLSLLNSNHAIDDGIDDNFILPTLDNHQLVNKELRLAHQHLHTVHAALKSKTALAANARINSFLFQLRTIALQCRSVVFNRCLNRAQIIEREVRDEIDTLKLSRKAAFTYFQTLHPPPPTTENVAQDLEIAKKEAAHWKRQYEEVQKELSADKKRRKTEHSVKKEEDVPIPNIGNGSAKVIGETQKIAAAPAAIARPVNAAGESQVSPDQRLKYAAGETQKVGDVRPNSGSETQKVVAVGGGGEGAPQKVAANDNVSRTENGTTPIRPAPRTENGATPIRPTPPSLPDRTNGNNVTGTSTTNEAKNNLQMVAEVLSNMRSTAHSKFEAKSDPQSSMAIRRHSSTPENQIQTVKRRSRSNPSTPNLSKTDASTLKPHSLMEAINNLIPKDNTLDDPSDEMDIRNSVEGMKPYAEAKRNIGVKMLSKKFAKSNAAPGDPTRAFLADLDAFQEEHGEKLPKQMKIDGGPLCSFKLMRIVCGHGGIRNVVQNGQMRSVMYEVGVKKVTNSTRIKCYYAQNLYRYEHMLVHNVLLPKGVGEQIKSLTWRKGRTLAGTFSSDLPLPEVAQVSASTVTDNANDRIDNNLAK